MEEPKMSRKCLPGTDFTKKQCVDFIRMKVRSDDEWAFAAMKRIYGFQTAEEKRTGETVVHNEFGFTTADGQLSAMCRSGKGLDELSEGFKAVMRNKMKKYAGQLYRVVTEVLHTEGLLAAHMAAQCAGEAADA